MLKIGNYIHSPAPDGGNSPDLKATGIISSADGVLFDGGSAYAGWMGSATSPATVNVVIDLLKDYPLDQKLRDSNKSLALGIIGQDSCFCSTCSFFAEIVIEFRSFPKHHFVNVVVGRHNPFQVVLVRTVRDIH